MTTIRIEGDGFVVDDNEHRYIHDAVWYAEPEEEYPFACILNPGPNHSTLPTREEFKMAFYSFVVSGLFACGVIWLLSLWGGR
jgi:hypothetical protein